MSVETMIEPKVCKRCGRPLTAGKSIERGIGPICANKDGGGTCEPENQIDMFGDSFIHTFKGYGGCKSQCRVNVIEEDGQRIVVFTDLGIGTSVTNMSEHIATDIVNKLKFDPLTTLFAERYRPGQKDETIDQILYQWDGVKYSKPEWRPLSGSYKILLTKGISNG